MGFTKLNSNLPKTLNDFALNRLDMPEIRVLAEWLGIRRELDRLQKAEERRNRLKQEIAKQPERAQRGYEIIVLQLETQQNSTALPKEMEERMYSVLTGIIAEAKGTVTAEAVGKLAEASNEMKKVLATYAREQVKLAAEMARPIVIKEKGKTRTVKGVLPKEFERMVQLGAARKNIMLVGPAGCGKTYLAAKLAEALKLDFADQSCSAGLSESAFTGWLLPVGKSGQFEYVESPFIRMYENGGVFLFDEMDAADANLLTFLNKALANDSFYLPQRYKKPLVKRHPDFVAIGAANTYGHGADAMYVGRNQLDAATLDRFRVGMITMDYSKEVEESIGNPKLLEWAWKVREAIRVKSLRRVMSTRTIKDLADMSAQADWGQKEWADAYFTDWSTEELGMVMPMLVKKEEVKA